MKNTFDKIKTRFAAFETDAALQLEKGNKAAGARARAPYYAMNTRLTPLIAPNCVGMDSGHCNDEIISRKDS